MWTRRKISKSKSRFVPLDAMDHVLDSYLVIQCLEDARYLHGSRATEEYSHGELQNKLPEQNLRYSNNKFLTRILWTMRREVDLGEGRGLSFLFCLHLMSNNRSRKGKVRMKMTCPMMDCLFQQFLHILLQRRFGTSPALK